MLTENLDKLETVITGLIDKINQLQAENQALNQKIETLQLAEEKSRTLGATVAEKNVELLQLKNSHNKLKKQQSMIRIKVENILENLEKIDFV